jgi:hypothetical protein
MKHCDLNPNVVYWNSEGMVIPYFLPTDGKMHRYFVDFVVTYKQKDGSLKTFLVEIKPHHQTQTPKKPTRLTEKAKVRLVKELLEYEKNQAKWKQAREYCKDNNMEFVILTENDLFKK